MVAYTTPQQRKKEESEMLRGERYQIKFISSYMAIYVWHGQRVVTVVKLRVGLPAKVVPWWSG